MALSETKSSYRQRNRKGERERERITCCQVQACGVASGGGGGGREKVKGRGNNDIAGPILLPGMHTAHSTVRGPDLTQLRPSSTFPPPMIGEGEKP